MNYNLKKPCANCPFRSDIKPFITGARAKEICNSLVEQQQTFPCHKTVKYDDDEGNGRVVPKSEHCAGAMIMLERMQRPNQMMRIAERLGIYDYRKLDMESPVYQNAAEMIAAHRKARA